MLLVFALSADALLPGVSIVDNGIRVQVIPVSQNARRWWIVGLMLVGIIPFLGSSLLPFFGSTVETAQPTVQETITPTPAATATPTQVSSQAKQEELKGQLRGYESILQQEPDNQTALMGVLLTRQELVQMGAADVMVLVDPLERLVKLNPNDVQLQSALGRIYAQQQRYDQAIAVFDKLIQNNKQDYQAVFDKGIVLKLQGKSEEAKTLFATAANLAPEPVKQQLKAQIQQIETATSAPKNGSTTAPTTNNQAQPATTAPQAAPKTTSTTPPVSDTQAKPAAPTPEVAPPSSATTPPASNNQAQPVVPTPESSPSP